MAGPKRYLCEGCKKLSDPHGTLCPLCSRDYGELRIYYNRLISIRPELAALTLPQAFLALAKAYIAKNT